MADSAASPALSAAFRLEFGGASGWGHLARCAALAAELKQRRWFCVLWTDGDLARAPADLRNAFDVVLPAGAHWLEQPPAAITAADWIVVDHYGADDGALEQLRGGIDAASPARSSLLAIDDEARRQLAAASLILNPRLGLSASPYAPAVPTLLGERYALLRPGLRAPEPIEAPFSHDATGVLIVLGGTDPLGLTATAIDALAAIDPRRFVPVVVRAHAVREAPAIRRALDQFAASVWLEALDAAALAGWARQCRYAISAAGGTLYELAFLNLPFVAIVVAENQQPFAAQVSARWRLPVIAGAVRTPEITAAFAELTRRFPNESRSGPRARFAEIDGNGAARVADAMAAAVRR